MEKQTKLLQTAEKVGEKLKTAYRLDWVLYLGHHNEFTLYYGAEKQGTELFLKVVMENEVWLERPDGTWVKVGYLV